MSKVQADPRALREVRASIDRGQQDIARAVNAMRASLKKADWHDERRRAFEQDLEQVLRSLSTFNGKADDLKRYLSRKADELDRFLSN